MKKSINIKGKNKLMKKAVERKFANIHSLQNSRGNNEVNEQWRELSENNEFESLMMPF